MGTLTIETRILDIEEFKGLMSLIADNFEELPEVIQSYLIEHFSESVNE